METEKKIRKKKSQQERAKLKLSSLFVEILIPNQDVCTVYIYTTGDKQNLLMLNYCVISGLILLYYLPLFHCPSLMGPSWSTIIIIS